MGVQSSEGSSNTFVWIFIKFTFDEKVYFFSGLYHFMSEIYAISNLVFEDAKCTNQM